MLDEFLNYIRKNRLLKKNSRVLLTVSGGIDSMVMAHLFIKAGIKTGIAHCNFCLRGEESDRDEELVRDFSESNRIPFYTMRFNTREYAGNKGISVQMAARELRYEWFETVRKKNKYNCIAVAHNLNDNIETLLINLTRGTGLTGLTGMKPLNDRIIRPLLFATRDKIADYCRENGIEYREDRSNAETKYTRNKIRHLVIPVLKEINPAIEEILNETSKRLAGVQGIVTEYVENIREKISSIRGEQTIFSINRISDLRINQAVLFEIFKPYGITGPLLPDLIRLLAGRPGRQVFTKTHRIVRDRSELIVSTSKISGKKRFEISRIEDFPDVPYILSAEVITGESGFRIPDDNSIACLDYEKVKFPVIIRSWEKGDHFFPLGMDQKKKLSDYFIDRKFSILKKDQVLVMESDGKITWIVGERIDDRFKVTGSTSRILVIWSVKG
ncbi:MAG: tRNA lysidine(34) synthetase TilS [Bacteroidota bacterium]|nr:tRNA lysidine(34) synthetase TilS [Bacteroidota bacterium]